MDKRTDVISLRRVLEDVRNDRCLLTRENYVSHDGLPYNYEAVRDAFYSELFEDDARESGWIRLPTTGPKAFDMARMAHEAFDKLCEANGERRARTDMISDRVFKCLEARLEDSRADDLIKFSSSHMPLTQTRVNH
jgi:hypothetical protein